MVPNIATNSNPLLAGNPLMRTFPLPHHRDSDQQGPADRERETPWIRNLLPRQLPSSTAITVFLRFTFGAFLLKANKHFTTNFFKY